MLPPEIGPDLLWTLLLLSLLLLVIYSNFACLLSSFHTISIASHCGLNNLFVTII